MDKAKKRKIIIISIVILVIVGLILLVLRLGDEPTTGPGGAVVDNQPVFETPSAKNAFEPVANPPETDAEFTAVNLARSYAERYGSWSTDSAGRNLQELIPLSTRAMQGFLGSVDVGSGQEEYLGLATKSLSTKILSIDDNNAAVMVSTQRAETGADFSLNVYYQDILISMVSAGNSWLVSSARWQEQAEE